MSGKGSSSSSRRHRHKTLIWFAKQQINIYIYKGGTRDAKATTFSLLSSLPWALLQLLLFIRLNILALSHKGDPKEWYQRCVKHSEASYFSYIYIYFAICTFDARWTHFSEYVYCIAIQIAPVRALLIQNSRHSLTLYYKRIIYTLLAGLPFHSNAWCLSDSLSRALLWRRNRNRPGHIYRRGV